MGVRFAKNLSDEISDTTGKLFPKDVDPKSGRRATIAELLKFATDDLKLDYIFWCTEEPYFSNELVPFMRSGHH